jgi:glycosyltransferase involved in cell wall biosynthesis
VARNLALEQVTAPYVCMVDADDWLSADALETAVAVMEQHPRTDCCVFHLRRVFESDGHEEDFGLPTELELGDKLSGGRAFELCLDGWKLHGLYLTRTPLHQQIPFDTSTRLYSDDNTSRLHYLHSREVRACAGIYYYRQHQKSMTQSFNLRRFDFMEANLSLLLTLKRENVHARLIRRYEVNRWMTFISCYRLYLQHEGEIPEADRVQLHDRFHTILHTFRPSRLPWRARWKPGYWLFYNDRLFDLQQRAYRLLRS